jgi:hypothetical protein
MALMCAALDAVGVDEVSSYTFAWKPASGAESYIVDVDVYLPKNGGGVWNRMTRIETTLCSQTLYFPPGAYRFCVIAVSAFNMKSAPSAWTYFSIEARVQAVLGAPVLKAPAGGVVFDTEALLASRAVTFRWGAVDGANRYLLTVSRQADGVTTEVLPSLLVAGTAWTMNDITAFGAGVYTWTVTSAALTDGVLHTGGKAVGTFTVRMDAPDVPEVIVEE